MNKKQLRDDFRKAVFQRDNNKCVMCGRSAGKLDAHHITDRHEMPNGGYVLENGITLCADDSYGGIDNCHWKAERFHATGYSHLGYSPKDLYNKIGSSQELAIQKSKELE